MIPVLTVSGLQFANLITGTIVVENVFVLPGIGRLVFQAISNRDLLVVRDVVMLLAAVVVAMRVACWARCLAAGITDRKGLAATASPYHQRRLAGRGRRA